MKEKHKILFIGGLGSTGRKAENIKIYLNKKGFKNTVVDIITPDYINEKPQQIQLEIQKLIENEYNYIFASSTGCLFALIAIDNANIKINTKIGLINPLLYLSESRQLTKDKVFLSNVMPLINHLPNINLDKENLDFIFFLSNNDEVIGTQTDTINQITLPKTKKLIFFNDNHRMGKSMDDIIAIMFQK